VSAIAASPWILAVVFLVAGLDALLPFLPSESTVVACGVAAAATGRPALPLLVATAAAGAYAGDQLSFRIGRRGRRLPERFAGGRVHDRLHRLLHTRGGLVIVLARYLPGGRSATALAAGALGYPAGRFARWTAAAVVLWATQAALLGYLGGALFAGRPAAALALGLAGALVITGVAVLIGRPRTAPAAAALVDDRR
jgi:membrane-associated protein